MNERLFSIGLRHKNTREKLDVLVWAENVDKATHKLTGILIGPECEYDWTGSGPVYKDNKVVERKA
jgi:hypothetical protein